MIQRTKNHTPRITVSMSPDQHIAVAYMAFSDGHDIASRIIQDAIGQEIKRRLGDDWRAHVREWEQTRKAALA